MHIWASHSSSISGRLGGVAAPLLLEASKQYYQQTFDLFITMVIILMVAATTASGINLIW